MIDFVATHNKQETHIIKTSYTYTCATTIAFILSSFMFLHGLFNMYFFNAYHHPKTYLMKSGIMNRILALGAIIVKQTKKHIR
jgi:hypothetical protein